MFWQNFFDDDLERKALQLEMAVLCDVGRVIKTVTYALEGGKPLAEKVRGYGFC